MTNTHTPETTSVSGTKTWDDADDQDGKRPTSITVNLLADGTVVKTIEVTPDADGNWTYSFTDLPKYKDGAEITYTVTEDAVADYTTTINGFDIKNTHVPETTSVKVTKAWADANDKDGLRPASVTVRLMDGEQVVKTATLSATNSWTVEWTDLPVYAKGQRIDYKVVEDPVAGYTTKVTTGADGLVVTNTPPAMPCSRPPRPLRAAYGTAVLIASS